jgi:hypothetical protein
LNFRGNKEKNAFRRTKQWKDFRKKILKRAGGKSELTGRKASGMHCHHLNDSLETYTDLSDEEAFIMVSKQDHKFIERFQNAAAIDRVIEGLTRIKNYYIKIGRLK